MMLTNSVAERGGGVIDLGVLKKKKKGPEKLTKVYKKEP